MNALAEPAPKQTIKLRSHPRLHVSTHESADVEGSPVDGGVMAQMNFVFHTLRTKKISMSALHAVICLYLNRERQISLSTLAANLGVSTAAVTSVADGMEKLGFARRRVNNLDRRLTWIGLTPRGIAFAEWFQSTVSTGALPMES